jgi:hypothetical protein
MLTSLAKVSTNKLGKGVIKFAKEVVAKVVISMLYKFATKRATNKVTKRIRQK